MIPFVAMDEENLEYFQNLEMVCFFWFNIISFHHVVWITFINGPIFLILSYLEFLEEAQIESLNSDFYYDDYVKVRMIRAIIVYVILCLSQYLQ